MHDNQSIVTAIRQGDANAFAELVRQYHGPLLALAYQFTGQREDAEDLVQETFIAAYRDLPTLREAEKLRGWLHAILRHLGLRWRARRRPEEPLDERMAAPPAGEDTAVFEAMQRLSAADREMLVLRYLNELDFKEIGGVLGISAHTAEVRCARARQRLKKSYQRQEDEEEARLLVRRAMGVILAGAVTAAAVDRVMAAVSPLMGAPLPPAPPLLNPATLQPFATLKVMLVKGLVAVGVAGALVTGGVLLPKALPKRPAPVVQAHAPIVMPHINQLPVEKAPEQAPPAPPAVKEQEVPRPAPRAPKPTAAVPKLPLIGRSGLPLAPAEPPSRTWSGIVQSGLAALGPVTLVPAGEMSDENAARIDALMRTAEPKLAAGLLGRRNESLRLLTPAEQEQALRKLGIDRQALADPANWQALVDLTGVKYIVLGEMIGGNGYSLDLRLVEIGTKHDVAAASVIDDEQSIMNGEEPARP